MAQVKKAAEADAAAATEGASEGGEAPEGDYTSGGGGDAPKKSGGTLASDEQLAALREKLSGGS
jgi:small subunit ribosomal protein S1